MSDRVQVLYMDDDMVAVHKPAGLKMHRDLHDRPCADVLLRIMRVQTGRWVYPVHRLDRPVSGVVLFAFSPDMARALAGQFRDRKVAKTYVAVTRGYVEPQGRIDSPLTRNAYEPKQGQVPIPALTTYQRLAAIEMRMAVNRYATSRYCLAAIYPHTGRMHQIRRHFRHIRHPLIGDTTYGDGRHNRFFREHFGCRRLLLAAVEIRLEHPGTGIPLHLIAPVEKSFRDVLGQLGWLDAVPEAWVAHPSALRL
jgi:tRNA pseudouridine65 synthase